MQTSFGLPSTGVSMRHTRINNRPRAVMPTTNRTLRSSTSLRTTTSLSLSDSAQFLAASQSQEFIQQASEQEATQLESIESGTAGRTREQVREYSNLARRVRSILKLAEVQSVSFSLYSFEELMRTNPIIINKVDTTKQRDIPHHGTVNDPRMGASGPHSHCSNASCHGDQINCYGHYGVIVLNEPIITIGNFGRVVKVLTSVCRNCGIMLLSEESIKKYDLDKYSGEDRLTMIADASKGHDCRRPAEEFLRTETCARAKRSGVHQKIGNENVPSSCFPTYPMLMNHVRSKMEIGMDRQSAIAQVSDEVDINYKRVGSTSLALQEKLAQMGTSLNQIKPGKEIKCARNPTYGNSKKDYGIVTYTLSGMADIHNEMEMEEIICLFEMIDTEKKENDAENLAKERRNRERELRNKEIREAVAQGRIVTNVKEDMEPLTKSTVDLLGINPLDLIMCAVQVIPPCYRTTTTYESAFDSDFLGNRYNNIIRYNEELDPQKRILVEDSKQTSLTRVRRNLYDEIKLLYDNPKSKDGDNKRNPPGIKQALKSKEGQYRNNMEGKRVDNAARTVVSPDPMLRFGQVGVPLAIAKVVNVPVTVTSTNQPELMALLQAGRVNYVYRGDLKDNRIKVEIGDHNRESYVLKPGDKVLRWLQNGDYVLAGRQPTLHIQSLMGHEVVIHNDLTLKFGLFETSPYNMDFDGDEATIYVPLTEEGFAELQGTKNVINNIIDPETGKPAMAAVMDVLTAAYRLTQKRKPLSESQWNDLVMYLLPETFYETIPTLTERLHRHGVERFTGRALISAMFPPDFYYKGMIVDGIYKMGSMGKDDIGRSHGGIVQKMWRKYPHQRLANLFTDLSHVLNVWQQSDPLSLGLQDMPQTDELNRAKNMEVAKVRAVASQTGGGQLDDPIEKNRREQQMTIYVNELESRGKEYVKPILGDNNAFIIMGSEGSGAKGGILNILQTSFVVGPQNLFGKRLPKVMRNGTVCLPYFDSDDTSPDSRGFCENSYLTGLSPAEWFFTHWAGREGLVNTAITTAKTGYLGRLLHNLTEDLITRQDGTVRNANNEIVQLNYSVDGFSPMMVSPMKILPDGEKVRWFIDIQDEAKEINAAFGFY